MYIPEHFRENDPAAIAEILSAAPLAMLVANTQGGLVANHLPLLVDKTGELVGHVALSNDVHRLIPDGADVLAVFRGVDGYVTPNSYPSKAETHRSVPTWNYEAVHVHGTIRFLHDERDKRAAVGLLTQLHERALNGGAAWRMADAPHDYMAEMLDRIVAFRISVVRTLAKAKLSQNRSPEDRQGVIANLQARGEAGLAERMARPKRE
jgi:transcriptional regulator